PKKQAKTIEFDVRPVLVRVRLFDAVAEVAGDRDLIRMTDFVRVLAGVGTKLKIDRTLRFRGVTGARERDRRVRHVAHPRDVPIAGWKAGEDLPVAFAGLAHLAHA